MSTPAPTPESSRPTTPEVRLQRLTGTIVEQGFDKAILPMGATEYHGDHMSYGTDSFIAEAYAESFARALGNTLVLPVIRYGISPHHMGYRWTMTLRPETLDRMVRDIADSLVHHGIRKLLIVCAHDGNPPVAMNAGRLLSQQQGLTVAVFNSGTAKAQIRLADGRGLDPDHGGESEMAALLYAAPETARPDLATNRPIERASVPLEVLGMFEDDRPAGFSGNAADATGEEGAEIIARLTDLMVPFLRALDANGWTRGPWMHTYRPEEWQGADPAAG
jgi:creatinine amidohydrolase